MQPYALLLISVPADAHGLFLLDGVDDTQHVERFALILLVVGLYYVSFLVDYRYRCTPLEVQAEQHFQLARPTLLLA